MQAVYRVRAISPDGSEMGQVKCGPLGLSSWVEAFQKVVGVATVDVQDISIEESAPMLPFLYSPDSTAGEEYDAAARQLYLMLEGFVGDGVIKLHSLPGKLQGAYAEAKAKHDAWYKSISTWLTPEGKGIG